MNYTVMSVLLLFVLGCTRAEMGNTDEVLPRNGTYLAVPAKGQEYEKAFRFRVQDGLVSGHAGRLDADGHFLPGYPIASGGCEAEALEIRLENGLGYYFHLTTASGASMVADEFDSVVVEYVIRTVSPSPEQGAAPDVKRLRLFHAGELCRSTKES